MAATEHRVTSMVRKVRCPSLKGTVCSLQGLFSRGAAMSTVDSSLLISHSV